MAGRLPSRLAAKAGANMTSPIPQAADCAVCRRRGIARTFRAAGVGGDAAPGLIAGTRVIHRAMRARNLYFRFASRLSVRRNAAIQAERKSAQGGAAPGRGADAMRPVWERSAWTGTPGWDLFAREHGATMIFGVASRIVNDPDGAERRLLAGTPVNMLAPGR